MSCSTSYGSPHRSLGEKITQEDRPLAPVGLVNTCDICMLEGHVNSGACGNFWTGSVFQHYVADICSHDNCMCCIEGPLSFPLVFASCHTLSMVSRQSYCNACPTSTVRKLPTLSHLLSQKEQIPSRYHNFPFIQTPKRQTTLLSCPLSSETSTHINSCIEGSTTTSLLPETYSDDKTWQHVLGTCYPFGLSIIGLGCPPRCQSTDKSTELSKRADTFNISQILRGNTSPHLKRHDDRIKFGKRWFSVEDLQYLEQKGKMGKVENAPWPEVCGHSWLRYCFKNEQSVDSLLDTLANAIALWAPAEFYTDMIIQPDYACGGDYRCICGVQPNGQSTANDALVISDGRSDPDDEGTWLEGTETTSGYNYLKDTPGRHFMQFPTMNNLRRPISEADRWRLISSMAHELGKSVCDI